jgi:hypothetical protein
MRCALYVGAGTDTRPLTALSEVTRFLYVDGQPESEFPEVSTTEPGYARPRFLAALDRAMADVGFVLDRQEGHVRTYRCGVRWVEYHTNTGIPSRVSRLPADVCDTLIVAGHHPHSVAVERCCHATGLTFVGLQGTVYRWCMGNLTSVVDRLHTNETFRDRFESFRYLTPHGSRTAETWEQFCAFLER